MTSDEIVSSLDSVDKLEEAMLEMEQADCPVRNMFAPNVYIREIYMKAGLVVIGHRHTTHHFNNLMKGKLVVSINGIVKPMCAPFTFVSSPGDRKAAYIIEDVIWQTIHPIDVKNVMALSNEEKLEIIDKVEIEVIKKSQAWLEHNKQKELVS